MENQTYVYTEEKEVSTGNKTGNNSLVDDTLSAASGMAVWVNLYLN